MKGGEACCPRKLHIFVHFFIFAFSTRPKFWTKNLEEKRPPPCAINILEDLPHFRAVQFRFIPLGFKP